MNASVCSFDSKTIFDVLGDPREFEKFHPARLQKGDFAVVAEDRIGAIFFMRPRNGEPKSISDGNVLMTRLLLGENANCGEEILRNFTRDYFTLRFCQGQEIAGVSIPFFILD